jgi:site-specific recombinase XerD
MKMKLNSLKYEVSRLKEQIDRLEELLVKQLRIDSTIPLIKKEERKKRERTKLGDTPLLTDLIECLKIIKESKGSDFVKARQSVSLTLLFGTGLRVSNLLLLTKGDLKQLKYNDYKTLIISLIKTKKPVAQLLVLRPAAQELLKTELKSAVDLLLTEGTGGRLNTRKRAEYKTK